MLSNTDYVQWNKQAYNEMAGFYRVKREKGLIKISYDIEIFLESLLFSFLNPSVLEIGPGAGATLRYFDDREIKTTAIDISPEMIKIAKEVSPETEFFEGNFLEYDFGDRRFHGIFAKSVIHLFPYPDAKKFLSKAYELHNNKGLLYLSTFASKKSNEGLKIKVMEGKEFCRYKKDWTVGELEEIVKNSPFEILRSFYDQNSKSKKYALILRK